MNLKFHDEKFYGFWGGLYAMPEPDGDDAPCTEVAAICDIPEAPRLVHLFCKAEQMEEVIKLGVAMRECQKRYFADRSKENLIASKQAETAFDKAAKAVLEAE